MCRNKSYRYPSIAPVPAMSISRKNAGPRSCPFCSKSFSRLGNYRHCRERGDQDYTKFLVSGSRTKQPRGKDSRKEKCPKCGRFFQQLDPHLRKNATCMNPCPSTQHFQQHNSQAHQDDNQSQQTATEAGTRHGNNVPSSAKKA